MPTQKTIQKLGVNPYAICNAQGLKGDKRERCIDKVTKAALTKKRKK